MDDETTRRQMPGRKYLRGLAAIALAMLITRGAAAQALQPGEIIVTNQCRGSVMRVDPVTGGQALISSGGLLVSPEGVAVSPDNSYLVVVDDGTKKAIRIDPVTGGQTLITDGLPSASGVTFEPGGQLLVTNESQVLRVNPATGQKTLVATGGFPLFGYANHLTVDTDGSILVPDDRGGVYRIDPATGEVTVLAGGPDFQNTGTVRVPAADPDVLYVGDYGRGGVFRLNRATHALSALSLGEAGSYGGAFALEANGDLVVIRQVPSVDTAVFRVSTSTGTRTLLTSGGELCSSWGIAVVPTVAVNDMTPPQLSCGAADGVWHSSNVTIACTANDPESGLANPADASFTLSTNVPTGSETADAATGTHEVCNNDGFCSTAGPISGNKVDKKPPVIPCGSADGVWHSADVAIACTGSDAGSGLANAADASFNLTTSVPAGIETANAATNSRQICDAVGACTTTGPIVGNKVDKKAPTITVTSPVANATYQQNAVVTASYACTDGGSGVLSCQGPVASGSVIDTSSTGTKTFPVNASDNVGNGSNLSVTYSVVTGGGGGQSSADLGVTLSAPAKVAPGGTLTYFNNGDECKQDDCNGYRCFRRVASRDRVCECFDKSRHDNRTRRGQQWNRYC